MTTPKIGGQKLLMYYQICKSFSLEIFLQETLARFNLAKWPTNGFGEKFKFGDMNAVNTDTCTYLFHCSEPSLRVQGTLF